MELRLSPAALAAGLLLVSWTAAPGRAELLVFPSHSACRISQFGNPGFLDYDSDGAVGAGPAGEKTVHVDLTRTDGFGPYFGYDGLQELDCFEIGAGSANYGFVAATLHSYASADPEVLQPAKGSGNEPRTLDSFVHGTALLGVGFDDTVEIASSSLGPEAPVTVDLRLELAGVGVLSGRPEGAGLGAASSLTVDVLDVETPTGGTLHRLLLDPSVETVPFDTAVGHHLRIQARLDAQSVTHAGRDENMIGPFHPTVQADLDTYGVVGLAPPESVQLFADSGIDYTTVPGAAQPLLLACGALVLGSRARRRKAAR